MDPVSETGRLAIASRTDGVNPASTSFFAVKDVTKPPGGTVDGSNDLSYQLIANLGSGSSGIVEKVKHVQTGQIYARKRIPLRMIQRKSEAVRKRAQDEIQVMKILSGHDHIVSVVGSYQTDRHLSILIYPVADEDLASFLDRVEGSRDVSKEHEDILSRSFGCLASGLAFMHQRHIRHGDIKPSNILLHQGHILYADFGIARDTSLLDQNRTTGHPGQFTKRYAPPEVFDYMPRGRSADVFSLGCVYVEILAALVPKFKVVPKTEDDTQPYCARLDQVTASMQLSRGLDTKYSDVFDVCQDMLRLEPYKRPTTHALVERFRSLSATRFFCDDCNTPIPNIVVGSASPNSLPLKIDHTVENEQVIVHPNATERFHASVSRLVASGHVPTVVAETFSDSGIDVNSRPAESLEGGSSQRIVVYPQDDFSHAANTVPEDEKDSTSEHSRSNFGTSDDHTEESRHVYETEITEFDHMSVSSEDSEVSLIDTGTQTLPSDLNPDEHLVRTKQWINRLESMEREVVERSSLLKEQQRHPFRPGGRGLTEVRHGFLRIALNLRTMKEAAYVRDGITAVIKDSQRDGVANLIKISMDDIDRYRAALESQDVHGCLDHLRLWGFREDYAHILEIYDPRKSFLIVATLINWLLDTAIVSFCGAHLEKFGEKYFEKQDHFDFECGTGRTLCLRPQNLRCLDGYLRQRPVWVFGISSSNEGRWDTEGLYLSTTLKDLNSTWGPVYVTHNKSSSTDLAETTPEILRFSIGLGWIIPRRREIEEPTTSPDELFAHYTNDPSDLVDVEPFPRGSQDARLLIGGGLKLSINGDCALPAGLDTYTSYMRDVGLMKPGQVRRPVMVRDTRTVTTQLSVFGVANVGYQETIKIRDGFDFRDQLTADWTNEPDRRNPSILSDWVAVEVSACTENARRRPLAMVLGSSTMLNYLNAHMDWEHEESKRLYLEAVTGRHIQALEILYGTRKELRMDIGRAIALCVNALHHTGLDTDRILRALWCPSQRKTWTAAFHYYDQIGLLKDTSESCAFAVLTLNCLEFRDTPDVPVLRCLHPIPGTSPEPPERINMTSNSAYRGHYTAFETSVIINPKAVIPNGLKHDGKRWKMRRCDPDTELDLGESGLLKYYGPIHVSGSRRSKGAFVRWSAPPFLRERFQQAREGLLGLPRRPCHRELVTEEESKKEELENKSLRVHVVAF